MTRLIDVAALVQLFVEKQGWDFFFIGGIAVQVWGEPRLTRDIDLTIFTNLDDEVALIDVILREYKPVFHDAGEFALSNRVLPVKTASGITIDFTLAGLADISEPLARASFQDFGDGTLLKICSPDDLVIMKTLAGRSRDWPDIEAVLIKQRNLDWNYIDSSIVALSEHKYEDNLSEKLEHLERLKNEYYRP
jgi:Nucleotidyl transferase AbiEii toxin, Type IV TA system